MSRGVYGDPGRSQKTEVRRRNEIWGRLLEGAEIGRGQHDVVPPSLLDGMAANQ